MTDLKPCPFCGGTAHLTYDSSTVKVVMCHQCGARGPAYAIPDKWPRGIKTMAGIFGQLDKNAVAGWNKRTVPQ